MADFCIDLAVLRAPAINSGLGGRAQVRLRSSDALTTFGGAASESESSERGSTGERLVWVSLYASSDGRFDSGDSLLVRRLVRLNGHGEKQLALDFSTAGLPVAEGSYNLIARIEPVGGQADSNPANNQSVALVNARGSDPILVWTSCALNAIQSAGSQGKPGVPPTLGTRLMAMLSTAMLDTVAAFGDKVNPYRIDAKAPTGADRTAAIVGAAQRILALELPGESEIIQAQLSKSLAELKGGQRGIQAGLAFGAALADQVRASRAGDGFNNTTPYTPPSDGLAGYVWMPATSGPTAGVALGANWGSVTPWVISGPDA